jgi:hypothetical protein
MGFEWFESVVLTRNFLLVLARRPMSLMCFATVSMPTGIPRPLRTWNTLGEPCVFFEPMKIPSIFLLRSSNFSSFFELSRVSHA